MKFNFPLFSLSELSTYPSVTKSNNAKFYFYSDIAKPLFKVGVSIIRFLNFRQLNIV
jgi:hypothetical protein